MRHLWSLLAGLVIAPLTWVLLAYGQAGLLLNRTSNNDTDLIVGGVVLAVAGLLVGFVAALRVSPLGSLLAGALLIAVSVLAMTLPHKTLDALPTLPKIVDYRGVLATPLFDGYLLFFGAALLVAVFSAGRWKRWPTQTVHPTVGPVNPMVDTGRIEAIKVWSPADEPIQAPATSPAATTSPIDRTEPIAVPPAVELSTTELHVPGQSTGAHAAKDDGDAPAWATPPTGR